MGGGGEGGGGRGGRRERGREGINWGRGERRGVTLGNGQGWEGRRKEGAEAGKE